MKQMLSKCSFEAADQRRFARLSGDSNPMHLDPLAARRTLFGAPVVHGIHVLLRALDAWAAERPPACGSPIVLRRLRGRFPNPTLVGEEVEFWLRSEGAGQTRLSGFCQGVNVLHLDLQWDYECEGNTRPLPGPCQGELERQPRPLRLDEIEGRVGTLALWGDLHAIGTEFPELARRTSARQIAELLACTRLVGMECPGLHSIFSAFDLECRKPELRHDYFDYRVAQVVPKASMVRLEVSGPSFQGRLDAFRRPEAKPPPSFDETGLFVEPFEFKDQTALIVGGSRGIGAMTAKLIAVGGGRPVITYHRGEDDALTLAREIRAGGGFCDVVQCDVANPGRAFNWLDAQGIIPTHLYYFASPQIFVKRPGTGYSKELYQRFAATYIDGFAALLLSCYQRRRRGLVAFYPSSVAVGEKVANLEEYSDAKRAGEALCREFNEADIPIHIRIARLPRIDTDQTASLIRVPAANALDVMLEELRSLKENTNG